ncbi:uncharacterized protein [Periplaneta americana]|uniref:uncharacterized protein n=1 Tax=Periplaneta americana TaxID=6978 RepID=UPI0037E7FE61
MERPKPFPCEWEIAPQNPTSVVLVLRGGQRQVRGSLLGWVRLSSSCKDPAGTQKAGERGSGPPGWGLCGRLSCPRKITQAKVLRYRAEGWMAAGCAVLHGASWIPGALQEYLAFHLQRGRCKWRLFFPYTRGTKISSLQEKQTSLGDSVKEPLSQLPQSGSSSVPPVENYDVDSSLVSASSSTQGGSSMESPSSTPQGESSMEPLSSTPQGGSSMELPSSTPQGGSSMEPPSLTPQGGSAIEPPSTSQGGSSMEPPSSTPQDGSSMEPPKSSPQDGSTALPPSPSTTEAGATGDSNETEAKTATDGAATVRPKKPNLSGAQRKRRKRERRQREAEALALAAREAAGLLPTGELVGNAEMTQKRQDGDATGRQNQLSPTSDHPSKRPRIEVTRPSWHTKLDNELEPLQVAIFKDSGWYGFTQEELLEFVDAVGELISATEHGSPPRFESTRSYKRSLVVTAADEQSKEWLVKHLPLIKPWPNVTLTLASPPEKLQNAKIWIPGKKHMSNEDTLIALNKQNPGIEASSWRILERKEERHGLRLVIGLDAKSISFLETINFQPYIKAMRATVTLQGVRKKEEKANAPVFMQNEPNLPAGFSGQRNWDMPMQGKQNYQDYGGYWQQFPFY